MRVYAVRHAQSQANRLTRAAFGQEGAPLTEHGWQQTVLLERKFEALGINTVIETAAVSELLRTQQTAEGAGFKNLVINPLLNEITTDDDPVMLMRKLATGFVPIEAVTNAQALLENPPEQMIWITHGLVIAGLKEVLNINNGRAVPNFAEITELNI